MASKGVRDLEIESWKGKEDAELRAEHGSFGSTAELI